MHSPEISQKVHWEQVYLQPSSGLFFNQLKIDGLKRFSISAEHAFVQFSWADLALLGTRLNSIHAPELEIHWDVSPTIPDGALDYAVPTESHLQQVHQILDTLAPVIGPHGVRLLADKILLSMAEDTLTLQHGQIHLEQNKNGWEMELSTDKVRRKDWPLPDVLKAEILFADSSTRMNSLQACWNGACLKGEGTLGMDRNNSKMNFTLGGVPLWPFGRFALPDQAEWRGQAEGEFQWEGRIAHPNTWKAQGNIELQNVQFVQWPFQQESTFSNFVPRLSKIMKIDQISIPNFELSNGRVKVDSLSGEADDILVQGAGAWTFPQRLDFRLKGSIHGELFESLPRLTKLALKKEEEGGAFKATLSGTFLWQAIIPASEHYGTALRNLFQ